MTHEICTEWQDGHIALLNPPRVPDSCTGLEKVIELIPDDFFIKATVSNLSSDFNTPTGRVFLACILLSSIALLVSEFPFWLPRRWLSDSGRQWMDSSEGKLRFVWLVVGTLCTAVVSVVPSPADAGGYDFILMMMHNIGAMVGYGTMVGMELAQLHYGENVFRRACATWRQCLCGPPAEHAPPRDLLPLNLDQWLRGTIMVLELCTGVVFISVQGSLTLFGATSQALAYYSVFLETAFAVLIYSDLLVMGLHGIAMDVNDVKP